jgi:hypothetical protein
MKKPLILTTIPAVLALCLLSACNKPGGESAPAGGGGGASPMGQSASQPSGSASTP